MGISILSGKVCESPVKRDLRGADDRKNAATLPDGAVAGVAAILGAQSVDKPNALRGINLNENCLDFAAVEFVSTFGNAQPPRGFLMIRHMPGGFLHLVFSRLPYSETLVVPVEGGQATLISLQPV